MKLRKSFPRSGIVGLALHISGCASVSSLVNYVKPEVSVADVRLSQASFQDVTLEFDVKIDNPNPIGVKLAALDYDFMLEGNSFVNGDQQKELEIVANGSSIVPIPVTLVFADVYRSITDLASKEEAGYDFNVGLNFNLPVIGLERIPVRKQGTVPLLRIPRLKLESLKLQNLGLTGADLRLNLQIDNPNFFALLVQSLDYSLEINNHEWVTGASSENIQISAREQSSFAIPISLNFMHIGQSAYSLLRSNQSLSYRLKGAATVSSSLAFLKEANLPFDQSGQLPLLR